MRRGGLDGDPEMVAALRELGGRRPRRLAAVLVALESPGGAPASARIALGGAADPAGRFELGSVTKGLTGMLLADGIARGELTLGTRVDELLPAAGGRPLGAVTAAELCTHVSGLPTTARGPRVRGLLGRDPDGDSDPERLLAAAARSRLRGRGRERYSNLGAAVLGMMLVAAAGAVDYGTLLATRILEPVGMDGARVAVPGETAPAGRSGFGWPRRPQVLGGYAPAGGLIATPVDLAALLGSLLDGGAPGSAALDPVMAPGGRPGNRSHGMFWVRDRSRLGGPLVWHNGATGGYSAFVAVWPERGAVAVLGDDPLSGERQRAAFALGRALLVGSADV